MLVTNNKGLFEVQFAVVFVVKKGPKDDAQFVGFSSTQSDEKKC